MIGGIVAVLIALWFYRTAESRGLPNFHWAVGGLIAYYVPNFIWSLAVAKPWVNSLHQSNATSTASLINFSSIFVGLAVAFLVHRFFMPKAAPTATTTTATTA